MAFFHALAAAALLGLGAAEQRARSRHGLEQEDASALVQVTLKSTDLRPGGILAPKRIDRRDASDFPLRRTEGNRTYHYVGSASFNIDFQGFHVHCYDIAMYLDSSSPLWSMTTKMSRSQKLDQMLDNVQFVTIAHSKWVNNANMAKFVDRLEFFAEQEGLTNYSAPIAAYKQVYYDGPRVHRGSHIIVRPGKLGVTPTISGEDVGLIKSDFIGRLVMVAYLGPDSDLPEFRDNVFAQLSHGLPEVVGKPAEVHAEAGNQAAAIAISVIVIVAAVCCCFGCLWWCCRRKSPAEKPLTEGK